jgi:long-chain acyl-CoA synthetase
MRTFSMPSAITIDGSATLTDQVWDNAEKTPQVAQFARQAPDGQWTDVSCERFKQDVIATARGLAAAGVEPAARVGLMSRTRYEWTVADYAILACGAVTVPIYDTAGEDQVSWTLSDSGAVGCVVETAEHRDLVSRVAEKLPGAFQVWSIDAGDLERLDRARISAEEIDARRRSVSADDVATIIYTSGTTGRPKGCVLTHRNLLTDVANAVIRLDNLFASRDAATLLFLPLAHSFARLVQFGCVRAGAQLAHMPDPRHLVEAMGTFRPTFLLAIPRVFEKVHDGARRQAGGGAKGAIFNRGEQVAVNYSEALDQPGGPGTALRLQHRLFDRLLYQRIRHRLGGRCGAAISGGAPLNPRLAHFFRGVGLEVYEGYGLTETSPAITANAEEATRIGTVGQPLPGVTIGIGDDDEVLVAGDVVFQGYFHNEQATAEVFDDDGWFHTGDLGSLDDDGYLTITGRKKDLIVTASGKNVAPSVLEDRLRSHPLISQAVVVGDRRPFIGALVTVDEEAWPQWLADRDKPAGADVAALRDDRDLIADVEAAVEHANQAVSRAEAIKRFRILPRDLSQGRGELTPTMKVKRSVVHEEYADEIDEIYRR